MQGGMEADRRVRTCECSNLDGGAGHLNASTVMACLRRSKCGRFGLEVRVAYTAQTPALSGRAALPSPGPADPLGLYPWYLTLRLPEVAREVSVMVRQVRPPCGGATRARAVSQEPCTAGSPMKAEVQSIVSGVGEASGGACTGWWFGQVAEERTCRDGMGRRDDR